MVITKTPFRMSFFGGGTDYPGFYEEHGGEEQRIISRVISCIVLSIVLLCNSKTFAKIF